MKISIAEFTNNGNSTYTVVPAPDAFPVGKVGGMVFLEVEDAKAEKLFLKQNESILLQMNLQELYHSCAERAVPNG